MKLQNKYDEYDPMVRSVKAFMNNHNFRESFYEVKAEKFDIKFEKVNLKIQERLPSSNDTPNMKLFIWGYGDDKKLIIERRKNSLKVYKPNMGVYSSYGLKVITDIWTSICHKSGVPYISFSYDDHIGDIVMWTYGSIRGSNVLTSPEVIITIPPLVFS